MLAPNGATWLFLNLWPNDRFRIPLGHKIYYIISSNDNPPTKQYKFTPNNNNNNDHKGKNDSPIAIRYPFPWKPVDNFKTTISQKGLLRYKNSHVIPCKQIVGKTV